MEINLKGTPAVIAIILIAAATIGYRVFLHSTLPKNPKVRQQLEMNLMSEIAGGITVDAKAIKQAMSSGDNEKASALAKGLLKRKVEISALDMKGSGDDIIVKATYTVHGQTHPRRRQVISNIHIHR